MVFSTFWVWSWVCTFYVKIQHFTFNYGNCIKRK